MSHSISHRADSGSTLMVTLLLALAVMIALEGFLSFLTTEYRLVHRTCSYDNAIYVAEAGIEEGVAMLNHGSSDWSGNGWSSFNATNYTKSVSDFTPASSSTILGNYTVSVYGPTNNYPVLICTGRVDSTYTTTFTGSSNSNICRAIRVILGKRAIFQWGLLAQSSITLNGNASVDSFDSSDSNYSNYDITKGFGTYSSTKNKDNGDIATNGVLTNIVVIGNADIYGHVMTGPGGTVSVGPNGFVGSLSNHPSGTIQSDRVSSSMKVDLPDATVPFSSGISLGNVSSTRTISGSIGSTPVDYTVSGISLNSSDTLTFTGYSRIYVTGNINTSGNSTIRLSAGAKVEIYVSGSIGIAGNGVSNQDQVAERLQIYSTGNQSVSITGNGEFDGVIYAPNSMVTLGGNAVVVGALIGNSFNVGGNAAFHYDEALQKSGPSRGYSILCWQEF